MEKGPKEVREIFQRFHSSFFHMILLTMFIPLSQTTQAASMVFYLLTGDTQQKKCHPPLVIVLDDTWDTKVRNEHERVSQPGYGSDKHFCSIKLCLHNNGINSKTRVICWGTGMGITYFDKQYCEDDVLLLLFYNNSTSSSQYCLSYESAD